MFLNDAFDRDADALERPDRPIPAGLAQADAVFAAGFGLMLAGLAFVLLASAGSENESSAMAATLALSAAILFYDWHHNGNPLSPYAMLALVLVGLIAWITVADEKVVAIIGMS